MLKKVAPYVLIICASAVSLGAVYWCQWHWLFKIGLPLDDSYIHLQFVKNILAGDWLVYSAGQPATPGDTSPLWILLIAGLGKFHSNLIYDSLILSGVFYALTGLAAYLLAQKLLSNQALSLASALVTVFTGRLLWTGASGMEGTLFSFLCLLGVFLYLRGKDQGKFSLLAAAIFGLAGNARPEGNLLFIFALLDWVLLEKIMREKKIRPGSIPWAAGMVFAVLAAPYLIFSLAATGHFTPNTYRATRLPVNWPRSLDYLNLVIQFFFHDHLLLHIFLPVGVTAWLARAWSKSSPERKQILVWLWPVGYLLISVVFTPVKFHFQRYLIPVLPFFIMVSFYGLEWVLQKFRRIASPQRISAARYVLLAMFVAWAGVVTLAGWPKMIALCVKNIDDMQVRIGEWVRDNTAPGDLIAANDIGAIFYLSQRPALDLIGLVNPELIPKVEGLKVPDPKRDQVTFEYLKQKKPEYLVVFPNWYPTVVEKTEYFQPVFSVTLTDNLICAADQMVVYKCTWPD